MQITACYKSACQWTYGTKAMQIWFSFIWTNNDTAATAGCISIIPSGKTPLPLDVINVIFMQDVIFLHLYIVKTKATRPRHPLKRCNATCRSTVCLHSLYTSTDSTTYYQIRYSKSICPSPLAHQTIPRAPRHREMGVLLSLPRSPPKLRWNMRVHGKCLDKQRRNTD